ncbi:hypothetical protein AYI69_g5516 [Smittium culicis]|uniref:Uncharacterized protein n=1 Tax=Smittium culicis TaxID=133412 RepID=A0A1R1Y581_9FUNG|nr:hypothetical protein AYI69_g5516 [Smittium culicis]
MRSQPLPTWQKVEITHTISKSDTLGLIPAPQIDTRTCPMATRFDAKINAHFYITERSCCRIRFLASQSA